MSPIVTIWLVSGIDKENIIKMSSAEYQKVTLYGIVNVSWSFIESFIQSQLKIFVWNAKPYFQVEQI